MAERKIEVFKSDEGELVVTRVKELSRAYEDSIEEYRSNPKRGMEDKKESLLKIAEELALLKEDCHFIWDYFKREEA